MNRTRLATAVLTIAALIAPIPPALNLTAPATATVIVPPAPEACASSADVKRVHRGQSKTKVTRIMHQPGRIVAHRIRNGRLTMTVRYKRCNGKRVLVRYREGRTLADGRVRMVVKKVTR